MVLTATSGEMTFQAPSVAKIRHLGKFATFRYVYLARLAQLSFGSFQTGLQLENVSVCMYSENGIV